MEELKKKEEDLIVVEDEKGSVAEQVDKRRKQLAKVNNKLKAAYEANNDIQ